MFLGLSSSIQTLNAVAIGDKAADLVLENCSLVNVYTGQTFGIGRRIAMEIKTAQEEGKLAKIVT